MFVPEESLTRRTDTLTDLLLLQCVERRSGRCHSPPVEYVVVSALPRCAAVEWQVTAASDVDSWLGLLCVHCSVGLIDRQETG